MFGTRFGGLHFVREWEDEAFGEWFLGRSVCPCVAAAALDWCVEEGHVFRIRTRSLPWAHWWFSPLNSIFNGEGGDRETDFYEWFQWSREHAVDCPER